MIKEEKPIFLKVFLIVIVILMVNLGVFSYKITTDRGLTGLSIGKKFSEAYRGISPISRVFLILQWAALIILLAGVFFRDMRAKKSESAAELSGVDINQLSKDSGTDLDVLYKILKEKKKLKISSISRLFKVKEEVAMEWCKILESGSLGVIEYPSAREPIIRLIE
ncbi:hypothetical protein A3K73_02725 [Candidatus Pacearchaeota archaeon RBG_13_36_9]|nr:MAG: hypothetical protein A3K73_02725 [Candidatus Pacearchaeota archaeon RBG_13_36_9]